MNPPARRKDAERKAIRDAWKTDGAKGAKESEKRGDKAKDDKKGGKK
ncbi:hypothetical protein [Actinomadura sp. 21ATH]